MSSIRITPERWQRIDRLFQSALDLPPEHRASYLSDACQGDAELRREIESLIESHERVGSFIEAPTLSTGGPFADETQGPERLGPYRILRELGRGGMGRVYLAEQEGEGFRRQVALKVVERRGAAAEVERRFRDERRILAALEHPGIARFYDAGRSPDGRWFLTLEYVEGEDLRAFVERRGLDPRSRVELFLQVLDAVDFAHRRLVVHRDLKPGNVLVDGHGRPKLLDFGISKILDPEDEADDTRTERPAFTLAYASPEQLRGERVTVATDIYSAGVMLYELLAGRRPFDRRETTSPEPDPEPPSAVAAPTVPRRDLTGDLDAIVLKALRPSPESRYPSAASFAADLRRWLAGEPVEAHRGGRRYRLAKFTARNRLALGAGVAVLVAVVGGLSVALVQRSRALAAQARAEATVADLHALTQSMLFEIHEDVQLLPNSLKVRSTIVRRATEVLERLAPSAGDDPRLLGDLASGYERLGYLFAVHPALGRSLGQPKAAVSHFERALALRERLAAGPTAGFAERLAAAKCLLDLAGAQINAGDAMGFARSTEGGIERLTALERQAPDAAALRFWLATAHARAWRRAHRSPALAPSIPIHAAAGARAWLDFLAAPSPALLAEGSLSSEAHLAGRVLREQGHPHEALRILDLGLGALDRGAAGDRGGYVAAYRRTMLLDERVNVLRALDQPALALAACKELLRVFTDLPTDEDELLTHSILHIGHHQEAVTLAAEVGDLEFAERALGESERALAEAEKRYGASAFALARVEQEKSQADLLAASADKAASSRERRRLRAAALATYQGALRRVERLNGAANIHAHPPEELTALRGKVQRLAATSGKSTP